MTKRTDDLVASICGAAGHPLAPFLRAWCEESRLFADFAEANATKIRKKARLALSNDTLAELLAELAVAACLARDRRFTLRYEPHQATGQRSPDFEVLFRAHPGLFVEVTRLRPNDAAGDELAHAALRLARALLDKIGQFQPGAANLLAAIVPPGAASDALVPAALRLLGSFPPHEAGPPSPELRPDDVRAFVRQRQRLSVIAICSFSDAWRPLGVRLWHSPQARHPLHPEIAKYLAQIGAA